MAGAAAPWPAGGRGLSRSSAARSPRNPRAGGREGLPGQRVSPPSPPRGPCPQRTNLNPRDIDGATPATEPAPPPTRPPNSRIRANPRGPNTTLLLHPPPNSPPSPPSPHSARLWYMHTRVCSSQPLNEVFAENLQFPHGLNLAKIAFLTLLGFNSNKPPLYYGTRSHCLDTARKSFIRRENGEGKRETRKERKEEERGDKQIKAAHFIRGPFGSREAAAGQQRGEVPSCSTARTPARRIISGAASPPTQPPTLRC